MADLNWGAGASGAAAGAGAGSFAGGPGMIIGGVIGGGMGLFSKKKKAPQYTPIDTTEIMKQIDALYNTQEQATQANLAKSLAGQNAATSESLAGRGIYSSPVSEYSFGKNRADYADSLSNALATLAANRASSKANVLSSAASINAQKSYEAEVNKYQQQLESSNMLQSLLASAGMAALKSNTGKPGFWGGSGGSGESFPAVRDPRLNLAAF